jgi:hypothetical protein
MAPGAANLEDPLSEAHPTPQLLLPLGHAEPAVAIRAWSEASANLEADRRRDECQPRLRPLTMIQLDVTFKGKRTY